MVYNYFALKKIAQNRNISDPFPKQFFVLAN